MTQADPTLPLPMLLTTAERDALRHGLADRHLPDLPLLQAALQQGDQLLPFLTGIADLLRTQQPETALAQLQMALAPILALDANAEALVTTLAQLSAAHATRRACVRV